MPANDRLNIMGWLTTGAMFAAVACLIATWGQ